MQDPVKKGLEWNTIYAHKTPGEPTTKLRHPRMQNGLLRQSYSLRHELKNEFLLFYKKKKLNSRKG